MRLFDLHCDTLMRCLGENGSLERNTFHIDAVRGMQLFSSWIQVTAAYIPDGLGEEASWALTERMLKRLYFEVDHSDHIVLADLSDNSSRSLRDRRMRVLPAVENGAAIGTDLRRIKQLASYGVIYITVTWNGSNALGNGCLSAERGGLTPFGKRAIADMYRHNILPDISHLNEAGFWDVISVANERPVLATHSLSKAVCSHPRNLTDEQFCAVRDSGGLVGLNLCRDQLGGDDPSALIPHLDRYLSLGGEHCVALGLDLDGTSLPKSWNGIAVAQKLYSTLQSAGYAEALLEALFFKNSYAFFEKALTTE